MNVFGDISYEGPKEEAGEARVDGTVHDIIVERDS